MTDLATERGFFSLYQSLIAIPTISSDDPKWDHSNLPLIQLLAERFASLGFKIEINELETSPGKFNLVASLGEGEGGLLLAGHTDTVPYDQGRWQYDPFSLTELDNKWFGLGSIDMKGFFAFVLATLSKFDLSKLQSPIRILATADEETTMAGARELHKYPHLKPKYAIIGEPTSMQPVYMHKGHMSESIRITGKSGHSSDPGAGLNAIEVMHQVIQNLLQLQQQLQSKYHNAGFVIPHPTLNLGHIHGGDSANRICGCCELHLDIRPLPGLSIAELTALLAQAVAPINAQYPNCAVIRSLHEPIPGFACATDSALVKLAEKVAGQAAVAVNYCTEAPFVQQLLGCDTIVMGPGSISQAHQPNEYLAIAEIKPTLAKLQQIIQQLCF